MEQTQETSGLRPKPKVNIVGSTLAGVAVGAGLLAAVGAGAGLATETLRASLDASNGALAYLPQFTATQGALGGAAVGAAVGGLSGYANADRARREAELLPDRGRRESWQERVIRERALAAARMAESQQGSGLAPSRA